MFSQRRRVEPMQTIYFRPLAAVLRARKFFAGLHLGNFTERCPSSGKTHISTSARMLRQRFTGPENPVPTVANRPNPTGLHQGRDRHEARRRHC
jgi:hypothetical protein